MSDETRGEETRSDRSRILGFVQVGAIAIVVLVAIYLARAPDRSIGAGLQLGSAPKPVVRTIVPTVTDQPLTVERTGVVSLETTVSIRAEISSKVVWISPKFQSGASIPAGEILVRIDPTDFELRVQAAQAAVKEAEAGVWREKARGKHDTQLFERNYPELEVTERVRRLPSLAKKEAQLLKAEVALKSAEEKLSRTQISLPFDAEVLNVRVELGELAHPDTPLGMAFRTDALQAEVPIEPQTLDRLAPVIGRAAVVIADGKSYRAEVARVSAVVAPTSRLATVYLKFLDDASTEALLKPGTFAHVSIEGSVLENVFLLPESAEQDQSNVWLVENGALKSHTPSTLAQTREGWIVSAFDVADGIALGTIHKAREGLMVQVKESPVGDGEAE